MITPFYIKTYIERNFNALNFSILSIDEICELILTTCNLIIEYLKENILEYNYNDKFEDIYDNLKELYTTQLHNIVYDEVLYNQLYYIQNRDNLNNDIVNVLFIYNKLIKK